MYSAEKIFENLEINNVMDLFRGDAVEAAVAKTVPEGAKNRRHIIKECARRFRLDALKEESIYNALINILLMEGYEFTEAVFKVSDGHYTWTKKERQLRGEGFKYSRYPQENYGEAHKMTGLPLYVLEVLCPCVTLSTQDKEKFDGDWFAALT